jgi:predicted 3-demethylubiquinone-9 3-methyltransferase (glyoxalase superfamily)
MAAKSVTTSRKSPAKRPKKTAAANKSAGPKKIAVQGITPFLWFEKNAEEAARFYVSIFKGSKILSANPMSVEFNLAGQDFYALNGGPTYKLTPAFSMFVSVKTQKDVDSLWETLSKGGEKSMCGWLVDRFGVSWQVIPTRLPELLGHKDPAVAQRAVAAMLKMQNIDIAALEKAARGG